MSSASSLSAPDGSSTIRGAESSSATSRRSSISPRRATVGQWMRDAEVPSR